MLFWDWTALLKYNHNISLHFVLFYFLYVLCSFSLLLSVLSLCIFQLGVNFFLSIWGYFSFFTFISLDSSHLFLLQYWLCYFCQLSSWLGTLEHWSNKILLSDKCCQFSGDHFEFRHWMDWTSLFSIVIFYCWGTFFWMNQWMFLVFSVL